MRKLIVLVITALLINACGNINDIPKDSVKEDVYEYSSKFINKLLNGDVNYCYYQLAQEAQTDKSRQVMRSTYENLKDKKLLKSSIINYSWTKTTLEESTVHYTINYEYQYDDAWVYFSFNLREKNGKLKVLGANISPFADSLREAHSFTLENKEITHYIFLFWALVIPLFILLTVIVIIKTPIRKKWMWIIFALMGIVSFKLNWTTGDIGFQLISIRLLGAGIVKQAVIAPWILTFAIPLGSILFWFKRAEILKEKEMEKSLTEVQE